MESPLTLLLAQREEKYDSYMLEKTGGHEILPDDTQIVKANCGIIAQRGEMKVQGCRTAVDTCDNTLTALLGK
jgi:hypothetical protein